VILLCSEGHMTEHKGAALMLDALPHAKSLIGDRGYGSVPSAPPLPLSSSFWLDY